MAKKKAEAGESRGFSGPVEVDSEGTVRLPGYEERVAKYRQREGYYKQILEPEIKADKERIREIAAVVDRTARAEGKPTVVRVELLGKEGAKSVLACLPDVEALGNRLDLTAPGPEVDALKKMCMARNATLIEEEEHFVLQGVWVTWFKEVLAEQVVEESFKTQYKMVTTIRLSATGAKFLREIEVDTECPEDLRKTASDLLKDGLKAISIR